MMWSKTCWKIQRSMQMKWILLEEIMTNCTHLVPFNGSVNCSMADPRRNAIHLTFKVTTSGTRTPRYTLYQYNIIPDIVSDIIPDIRYHLDKIYVHKFFTYTYSTCGWVGHIAWFAPADRCSNPPNIKGILLKNWWLFCSANTKTIAQPVAPLKTIAQPAALKKKHHIVSDITYDIIPDIIPDIMPDISNIFC